MDDYNDFDELLRQTVVPDEKTSQNTNFENIDFDQYDSDYDPETEDDLSDEIDEDEDEDLTEEEKLNIIEYELERMVLDGELEMIYDEETGEKLYREITDENID